MKKRKKLTKLQRLWGVACFIGHPLAGILTVLGAVHLHWIIWFIGPAGFVGYQAYENHEVDDQGWREMRDYWIGFWGTVAILLVLGLVL